MTRTKLEDFDLPERSQHTTVEAMRKIIVIAFSLVGLVAGVLVDRDAVSSDRQLRLNGIERQVIVQDRISNVGTNDSTIYSLIVDEPTVGRIVVEVKYGMWVNTDMGEAFTMTFDPEDASHYGIGEEHRSHHRHPHRRFRHQHDPQINLSHSGNCQQSQRRQHRVIAGFHG